MHEYLPDPVTKAHFILTFLFVGSFHQQHIGINIYVIRVK